MNINNKKWAVIFVAVFISCSVHAVSLTGTVIDHKGNPVADAVISLTSASQKNMASAEKNITTETIAYATMDQVDKQFVPYNLPVQAGTLVSFPNRDNIKHHVYSFSPPKKFETKLYTGANAKPIMFDKPGVVALGCNIHDWMLGYIYILDTPYFGKTDNNGKLSINNLPENNHYIVSIWHPRLRGNPEKYDQQISLKGLNTYNVSFSIPLKRERRRSKPDEFEEEEY